MRSPSPCEHPSRRNARPASPPLTSSPGQQVRATRRSLLLRNLSLVLAATVRGARGSHVRLISGLAAPRSTDVGRMTSAFSSVAGGRPRPWEAYQQSRAQRCADRRFPGRRRPSGRSNAFLAEKTLGEAVDRRTGTQASSQVAILRRRHQPPICNRPNTCQAASAATPDPVIVPRRAMGKVGQAHPPPFVRA